MSNGATIVLHSADRPLDNVHMIIGSDCIEGDWKNIRTNATKLIVCLYFSNIETTGRVKLIADPKLSKERLPRPVE